MSKWLRASCVILLLVIIITAWLSIGICFPELFGDTPAERGTFGDQFGAVNALFSGFAFAGVIVALWLQQRELRIAIQEQRDAARQHASIVKTQIILNLLDEIRSQEWGDAHAGIHRWRKSKGPSFLDDFVRERGDTPGKCEIDRDRRTFVKPVRKVWSLRQANVIDDDFCREIISSDIAETVVRIIFPMEVRILQELGRPTTSAFFDLVHRLYPNLTGQQVGPLTPAPPSVP